MGFIVAPEKKAQAQAQLQEIMSRTKRQLQNALPFAMEPLVYDFAINERGTFADLLEGAAALMPGDYYALTVAAGDIGVSLGSPFPTLHSPSHSQAVSYPKHL